VKSAYFLIPAAFTVPASFFFLLTINETSNLGAVYFYIFMSMIFVWTFIGPLAAVVIGVIPPHLRSLAGGLAHLIVSILGNIISPPIIGAVSDDSGSLRTGMQSIWITTFVSGVFWFCGYKFLPALKSDLGEDNTGKSAKESVSLSEFLWKGGIAGKRNVKTEVTIEVDNPMVEHGSEVDAKAPEEVVVKKPFSNRRVVPQSMSRAEGPDTSNPMHNGSANKDVAVNGGDIEKGDDGGEVNAVAAAPQSNRRVVSAALTRSDAAASRETPPQAPQRSAAGDRSTNMRSGGNKPVAAAVEDTPPEPPRDPPPQSNRRLPSSLAGQTAAGTDGQPSREAAPSRATPAADSERPASNRRVVPSSLSSAAAPSTPSPEAPKAAEGSRPASVNRPSSERGGGSSSSSGDNNTSSNGRSGRAGAPSAVSASPAVDPRPTSNGRRTSNFTGDAVPSATGASSSSASKASAQVTPQRSSSDLSAVAPAAAAPSSARKPAPISPVKSAPPLSDSDTWC
jgi:hypothetical protein